MTPEGPRNPEFPWRGDFPWTIEITVKDAEGIPLMHFYPDVQIWNPDQEADIHLNFKSQLTQ